MAFYITNDTDQTIADCNDFVIYTDQLWANKNYHRQGFDKNSMNKIHAYSHEKGCKVASLTTMSSQSGLDFYQKLGYVIEFIHEGYKLNSSKVFLSILL